MVGIMLSQESSGTIATRQPGYQAFSERGKIRRSTGVLQQVHEARYQAQCKVFNMDETGSSQTSRQTKVVVFKGSRNVRSKSD
uniref:Uncharacterized protein n=1 Tax=Hyaloperonospora arabidopsidis (strain Emoy2) TaxID=559515 RepID=M4BH78_HYAAE